MFWTVVFGVIFAYIVIKVFPFILLFFITIINFLRELPDKITDLISDNKVLVSRILLVGLIAFGIYLYDNSEIANKTRASKCPEYSSYFTNPVRNCICNTPYYPLAKDGDSECVINEKKAEVIKKQILDALQLGISKEKILENASKEVVDYDYYLGQIYVDKSFMMDILKESEPCEKEYGFNSYTTGEKNNTGGVTCYCKDGFLWNKDQSACISL